MGFAQQIADLTKSVNGLITTVKGQTTKWNNAVNAQIGKLESWKDNVVVRKMIDLSHLDSEKFYPVMISRPHLGSSISIIRHYSEKFTGDKMAGLDMKMFLSGNSWGGNPMNITMLQNLQTYNQVVGAVGYMHHGYKIGVFLRGGFLYHIEKNGGFDVEIIEEKTTYYKDVEYALTAGPVTLQECLDSQGAVGTWEVLKDHGKTYINELGA